MVDPIGTIVIGAVATLATTERMVAWGLAACGLMCKPKLDDIKQAAFDRWQRGTIPTNHHVAQAFRLAEINALLLFLDDYEAWLDATNNGETVAAQIAHNADWGREERAIIENAKSVLSQIHTQVILSADSANARGIDGPKLAGALAYDDARSNDQTEEARREFCRLALDELQIPRDGRPVTPRMLRAFSEGFSTKPVVVRPWFGLFTQALRAQFKKRELARVTFQDEIISRILINTGAATSPKAVNFDSSLDQLAKAFGVELDKQLASRLEQFQTLIESRIRDLQDIVHQQFGSLQTTTASVAHDTRQALDLLRRLDVAPRFKVASEYLEFQELPTDYVPDPSGLASGSRLVLTPNAAYRGRELMFRRLALLMKAVQPEPAALLVSGIGGIGKSQFAAEVARRYGQYFNGGVFWLSCASVEEARQELLVVSGPRHMKLWRENDGLDLAQKVDIWKATLADGKHRLLIFDNCEEPSIVQELMPPMGKVVALLTTRRRDWPPDLIPHNRRIALSTLDRSESIALLEAYVGRMLPAFDSLAEHLGDLPLGLHIAGRILSAGTVSVDEYIKRLEQQGGVRRLNDDGAEFESGTHTLDATFEVSWEDLLKKAKTPTERISMPARVALVALACVANYRPGVSVSRALLEASMRLYHPGLADEELRRGIRAAYNSGMLDVISLDVENESSLTFSDNWQVVRLHRLLAAYICRQRSAPNGAAQAASAAFQKVNNTISLQHYLGIPAGWREQASHLLTVDANEFSRLFLLRILGDIDMLQANYESAGYFYRKSHEAMEFYANSNPLNIPLQLNLSLSLSRLGDVAAAQGISSVEMQTYASALNVVSRLAARRPDDLDIGQALSSILFRNGRSALLRGNYEGAIEAFSRGLVVSEHHAATNSGHGNAEKLALMFLTELARSEMLLDRVEAMRDYLARGALRCQSLSLEAAPDTRLACAAFLDLRARLAAKEGNNSLERSAFKEALGIVQSLAAAEPTRMDLHAFIVNLLASLASAEMDAGRLQDAIQLLERGREMVERFGSNAGEFSDLQFGDSILLDSLGRIASRRGEIEQAARYYEESLTINERIAQRGRGRRDLVIRTLVPLMNIAEIREAQGQLAEASAFYERAIRVARELTAEGEVEHLIEVRLANALSRLGALERGGEELGKAKVLLAEGLQILRRLYTSSPQSVPTALDFARCLNEAALLDIDQNNTTSARLHAEESALLTAGLSASDDTNVSIRWARLCPLRLLGDLCMMRQDLEHAEEHFSNLLCIARGLIAEIPGDIGLTIELGVAVSRMAWLEREKGNFGKAEEWSKQSLDLAAIVYAARPKDQSAKYDYLVNFNLLGDACFAQQKYDEATEFWRLGTIASDIDLNSSVSVRREAVILRDKYGDRLRATGHLDEAAIQYRGALEITDSLLAQNAQYADRRNRMILLCHLGLVAHAKGKLEAAVNLYWEADAIAENLKASNPGEPILVEYLAWIPRYLADARSSGGVNVGERWGEDRFVEIETLVERALINSQGFAVGYPRQVPWDGWAGKLYSRLGGLAQASGSTNLAENCCKRAITSLQSVVVASPGIFEWESSLASAQDQLGLVMHSAGQLELARTAFRAALTGFEKLYEANRENLSVRWAVFVSANHLGATCMQLADWEGCRAADAKAIDLDGIIPEFDSSKDQHAILALSLHCRMAISDVYFGRSHVAGVRYRKCMGVWETALAKWPDDLELRVLIAGWLVIGFLVLPPWEFSMLRRKFDAVIRPVRNIERFESILSAYIGSAVENSERKRFISLAKWGFRRLFSLPLRYLPSARRWIWG